MNKKYIIFLVVIFFAGIFLYQKNNQGNNGNNLNNQNIAKDQSSTDASNQVEVKLDFGDNLISTATVGANTAFEALEKSVKERGMIMKTKKYDFGIFIESIGDFANTNDKAWIYYINGNSATQAADMQEVVFGDKLEWKYEKPIY